jgi:uroporphyrinogen decarboxylase
VDAIGDEALIITTIFNPYATGNDISGAKVTEHLRADPKAVSAGLATIAESLGEFAAACIEAGAAGIYFSAQGGEQDRFDVETWKSHVRPHDVTVLERAEEAGATFNLLHICGEAIRLEGYADYPAHAVNWAPQLKNLSLGQGRSLFRRTLVGGVDQRGPIVDGSRLDIKKEVRAAISEGGRAGFMVGAGCTVPNEVVVEHLAWAIEAAHAA